MHPDDRRQRRGWGAIAGLSAAAGAALAAAMIPAGVAAATTDGTVGGGGETTLNSDLLSFFGAEDVSTSLAKTDVGLTDEFLHQLTGGPTGTLGTLFENELEQQLPIIEEGYDGPESQAMLHQMVDNNLGVLLADEGYSKAVQATDIMDLNNIIGGLSTDVGPVGPVDEAAEQSLATIFGTLADAVGTGPAL